MKKTLVTLFSLILLLSVLVSCRPPELEGAFVDFNAGRYDNALKLAKESTEKYPNNAEAWFLLGQIYGKKSMFKEMTDAFDQSLKIGTTYQDKIKNERLYYFQTKYNDAVSKYNAFTKVEDQSSDKAKKVLQNAIVDFKHSIEITPNDYSSHRLIAVANNILNNEDEALLYYIKLTELYPDTVSSWLDLGIFHYNKRDFEKAIVSLKKAVKIDPQNAEPITYLAQSYDFSFQRDPAINAYKEAIKVNPEEKALPFNLGLLYIKSANDSTISTDMQTMYLKESVGHFERVIELDSEIKEAHQLKSTAQIRLEDWEGAKKTLLKGLDLFPNDADMWTNIGVCYARLNMKDEAEAAFKKAKELEGE
jgi:Flp pilus assembly protein TadD